MSGKGDRGQLRVVTVAVNVSRVNARTCWGWLSRLGTVPGDEGPDPGTAEGGQGCPTLLCSQGHAEQQALSQQPPAPTALPPQATLHLFVCMDLGSSSCSLQTEACRERSQ